MIISSVGSGILVSRTGKYKPILMAGLAVMAVGLYLMSNLRADTELPVLWSWMFVTGLGIGPTLGVFTIVVQNAVPVRSLGVATSNLTFFRQIGGSVGLAALGTVFGTRLAEEIPVQIAAAGVPQQMVDQFAAQSSGGGATDLIRVGVDLGATILAGVPPQLQEAVEPIIPKIVFGIQQAFSLAIDQVFLIGVGSAVAALVVVTLFMRQVPLRSGRTAPEPGGRDDRGVAGRRSGRPRRSRRDAGARAGLTAATLLIPAARPTSSRPGRSMSRATIGA